MDATFYQRYIEKRGFKEGGEFRYYLGEKSFGTFYGDYIEDTRHVTEIADMATSRDWQEMHKRWSYYFHHQTNFDSQFYIRTDLIKASDKWYFKDFSSQNLLTLINLQPRQVKIILKIFRSKPINRCVIWNRLPVFIKDGLTLI